MNVAGPASQWGRNIIQFACGKQAAAVTAAFGSEEGAFLVAEHPFRADFVRHTGVRCDKSHLAKAAIFLQLGHVPFVTIPGAYMSVLWRKLAYLPITT